MSKWDTFTAAVGAVVVGGVLVVVVTGIRGDVGLRLNVVTSVPVPLRRPA